MSFMEFAPSALSLIDEPETLHPTIHKILANTYLHAGKGGLDKKEFILKWSLGLKRIIDLNPTLAKILEKTSEVKSNIYLINEQSIRDSEDFFVTLRTCNRKLEICVAIDRPINNALENFSHELTHKLIHMTYNNAILPYENGGSFTEMDLALQAELKSEQTIKLFQYSKNKTHSDSWLKPLHEGYAKDKIAVEILPHFIGHITKSMLNNEGKGGVSFNFATIMWDYLHTQLKLELEDQELPPLSYYNDIAIDELDELTIEAINISANHEPHHSWFDSEAGKLAFKMLSTSQQEEYINHLFTLSDKNLIEILKKYLTPLYQSNSILCNYTLFEKLNGLNSEILNFIIINNPIIELLEAFGESNNWHIKSLLIEMSSIEIYQIIENQSAEFLKFYDAFTNVIISKIIVDLPDIYHLSIVKTYENELMQYCSCEYIKSKLITMLEKYETWQQLQHYYDIKEEQDIAVIDESAESNDCSSEPFRHLYAIDDISSDSVDDTMGMGETSDNIPTSF